MASVLFVCTGNICRSPIAEGLARALTAGSRQEVRVSSAGVVGWEGSPAVEEAVRAAAELGVDISGHRARRLERPHVEAADLVVCMAGEHREAVGRLVPEARDRTFSLKELASLLEELSPSEQSFEARVGMADRLRRSGSGRPVADEDVADPIGMPMDAFRTVAEDIEQWSGRLVAGLFGLETEREEAIG